MPKIKTRDTRLKDPARFHNYKAADKFEYIIEPHKILEEKGFQFPKQPTGMMNNIYTIVAWMGWLKFCAHFQDPIVPIVKEFYSNMLQRDQCNIFVRQVQVLLNSRIINAFYNLPPMIDCEYTKFIENMTVKK